MNPYCWKTPIISDVFKFRALIRITKKDIRGIDEKRVVHPFSVRSCGLVNGIAILTF